MPPPPVPRWRDGDSCLERVGDMRGGGERDRPREIWFIDRERLLPNSRRGTGDRWPAGMPLVPTPWETRGRDDMNPPLVDDALVLRLGGELMPTLKAPTREVYLRDGSP